MITPIPTDGFPDTACKRYTTSLQYPHVKLETAQSTVKTFEKAPEVLFITGVKNLVNYSNTIELSSITSDPKLI